MKITSIKHKTVSVPIRYPVVSCVRQSDRIVFVLADVETDEGITGISYAQAFHVHGARAIRACLSHLEPLVVGEDPRNIEKIWRKMLEGIKLMGQQGLPMFALSMIDIALWDIFGNSVNLPVCRLLGGEPGTFPAYQSDGLWLVSPAEAARQAEAFAAAGFQSMKMRLGRTDRKEDEQAVREVRQAIGEQIELMGDVNQGWSVETAAEMDKRLSVYGLRWLEEPVEAEHMEGHAFLSATLGTPVATGENLYGIRPFHRFLQMNAASVYTPDLQRTGGITGWKRINSLIEQYDKRSGIHLFPEYAVHLFTVIRHPVKLEWMSWASSLFEQPLACQDGKLQTPDRPGFGMAWDKRAISAYEID